MLETVLKVFTVLMWLGTMGASLWCFWTTLSSTKELRSETTLKLMGKAWVKERMRVSMRFGVAFAALAAASAAGMWISIVVMWP